MSNMSNPRTIDGADIIEADTINIFEKLEVNGATGNPKQLLRLKADGSENIEYADLETLTFTGATSQTYNGIDARTINIPSALTSAGNPLVISGGVISFNGNVGSLTSTGNITALATGSIFADMEITGDLEVAGNLQGDSATNISLINDISAVSLSLSGNLNANGNIVGDTATNITGINDISSATLTTSGNINANGNIVGDNATNITGINDISSATLTTSGNINANGNIVGDSATNISGINDISSATLTASGNINANGNIVGDTATDISGVRDIVATTISATGVGAGNRSFFQFMGISGDVLCDGNISMNTTNITDVGNITTSTITASGDITANGNIVGDTATNISSINNVSCASLTLSGTISSANIPSTITGSKTFSDTFQTNGNTTLCNSSGDLFVGDFNQTLHSRPVATFMSSIFHRFNTQSSNLVGTGGISGRQEFMRNNRIQQRSYFSPYQLSDYFLPNMPSNSFLYDSIDKLTGDTNHTPYRVIKLHPTDWCPNEDSTFNDIAIHDNQSYPTTGNTTYGGLMNRHSTIIEVWKYVDIPEGFKFKAIYLKVYSTTAGTSATACNVKVFKRHIGQHFNDAKYSVKILDSNTTTSITDEIPLFVGAGGLTITEHDKVNEYDNSMAIMVNMTSLTHVMSGGYIICEPVDYTQMSYSVNVSTGGTPPPSNITITIIDKNTPNTQLDSITMTAGSQTKTLTIPYTFGCVRDFFIRFVDTGAGDEVDILSIVNCEIPSSLFADNTNNNFRVVNQTSSFLLDFP